jgi:diadenosine tetraphosphate (Ap4A) HIT family hydrolase
VNCPFCTPELDSKHRIVLSNTHCLFLQKKQPVSLYNWVIIPRIHKQSVFDLTHEEWDATYSLLTEAKKLLDESYKPPGYILGWNYGTTSGKNIFHAHLHVAPTFEDESPAEYFDSFSCC